MERERFLTGSPGFTVAAALEQAPAALVGRMLGEPAVRLLTALDPALTDADHLRRLATRLLQPDSVLRNADLRSQLLPLLPIEKARELAKRLELPVAGNVFDVLKAQNFAPGSGAESILLRFFGVDTSRPPPSVTRPTTLTAIQPSYGLFDHQRKAALKVTTALSEAPYKVLLHMPTGAGKTRTAMHVVSRHLNDRPPTTVVWFAQTKELLEQAADEFAAAWAALGSSEATVVRYWGDAEFPAERSGPTFFVAGLAKMHALSRKDINALLKLADEASLTVIDEAHQAIAPTFQAVIEALATKRPKNGLLGLSATPGRTWADVAEDAKLSAFFGERKVTLEVEGYDNPVRYLIAEGYLAQPDFRMLNAEPGLQLTDADLQTLGSELDIPEHVLESLGEDEHRNLKIVHEVEELVSRHRRIIVFATTVAHARLLAAVLSARGVEAMVVAGDSPQAEREAAIRRFRGGDPRPLVMCNYGVLTTGFDAPKTSAAVVARPTKSLVLYSQMIGRAVRGPRAGGNERAEIVTVVDPQLPGFGDMAEAFSNWEDVWDEPS